MVSTPSHTKKRAISLPQALQNEPTFDRLRQQIQLSSALWQSTQKILPPALHPQCKPASYAENEWCILALTPSAAGKIKQLSPDILTHLRKQGFEIESIRVKITTQR